MSEDEQSPAPVVDAAVPQTATDSSTAPDAAITAAPLDAGNAPDPALPSGGDTVTGDAGNASGSTTGAPPSMPESTEGASVDTSSEQNTSEQTGDSAEQAYEAARVAAVEAGDTSWPTWGFLGLDQKLKWIDEQGAGHLPDKLSAPLS